MPAERHDRTDRGNRRDRSEQRAERVERRDRRDRAELEQRIERIDRMERVERTRRLDLPQVRRRSFFPEYDPEAFGRLSEHIARFIGTGRFIVGMTVVITAWVVWNTAGPSGMRFDDFPFIFLTLVLSVQASYAAPLILLAQNRQADRDRVSLEQDRQRNERSIADTEYLTREIAALRMGMGEVATRDWIRSELADLVKELDERRSRVPAEGDERDR